jgi:hypothetical protein
VHADALEVLARLQGRVNMAVLINDDNVWFSGVRRVCMVIAKAGRQAVILSPAGVGGCPPPVTAPRALSRREWM